MQASTFIVAFILMYCLLAVQGGCPGHGAHNHHHDHAGTHNHQHDHPEPIDMGQMPMPMLLLWVIGATLSVSMVSLAGMLLVMKLGGSIEWLEMPLVGFGAGSMLSAALLLFLPESIAHISALHVGYVVMVGALSAMFLELLIHAFTGHSHSHGAPSHKPTPTFDAAPAGHSNDHGSVHKSMTAELDIEAAAVASGCQSSNESLAWNCLIGDALHNLVDGVLIGTTFGASGIARGCIVTAAIIAHELPKEVAELVILFSLAGWPKKKALARNVLSTLTCLLGGIIGATVGGSVSLEHYALAFVVGQFLYISLGQLIPSLSHMSTGQNRTTIAFAFAVGVGMSVALTFMPAELHSHAH